MIDSTVDGETWCPAWRTMAQILRCPQAGCLLANCRHRVSLLATHWGGPRAFHGLPSAGSGLPAPGRPCSGISGSSQNLKVDIALVDPDYLEVLEGTSRPSALFFQIRNSTDA